MLTFFLSFFAEQHRENYGKNISQFKLLAHQHSEHEILVYSMHYMHNFLFKFFNFLFLQRYDMENLAKKKKALVN